MQSCTRANSGIEACSPPVLVIQLETNTSASACATKARLVSEHWANRDQSRGSNTSPASCGKGSIAAKWESRSTTSTGADRPTKPGNAQQRMICSHTREIPP